MNPEIRYKSSRIKTILKTHDHADCFFTIDGEKIPAHRLLLACSSPVFEQMFYGLLSTSEVEIKDATKRDFRNMLEFVYTDDVTLDSVQDAWNLFYLARKYLLEDLSDFCITYIDKNLTMKNLALSYEFSELYGEGSLNTSCWYDLKFYAKGLIYCDSEYHMKYSTLCRLLEESRSLSFYDKLILIVKWVVNECEVAEDNSPDEAIDIIKDSDLLKYVASDIRKLDGLPDAELQEDLTPREESVLSYILSQLSNNSWGIVEQATPKAGHFHASYFYKVRDVYKISSGIRVSENHPFYFNIETSQRTILFGFLINTEHQPCSAFSKYYFGRNTISVSGGNNTRKKIHACFSGEMIYDSTQYIPLDRLIVLDPGKIYEVSISYSNSTIGTSFVLLHYLNPGLTYGKFEKNKPFLRFTDSSGSVLRGVCYYPL